MTLQATYRGMVYNPNVYIERGDSVLLVNVNKYDPTRTSSLRASFEREMNRRFGKFIQLIKQAILEQDVFGIKRNDQGVYALPNRRAFAFGTSQQKVSQFMRWVETQIDAELLSVANVNQVGTGINEAWTNKYISDSYKRGVQRADYELNKQGFKLPNGEQLSTNPFTAPFHMDRLGVLYTRTFEELKGITSQMSTQISRVLTEGMANGDSATLLSRKLVATINGTGMGDLAIKDALGRFVPALRRARTLARTEIIRAHHRAMIQEYRNYGVAGVRVIAEFSTAKDDRVCPECEQLDRKRFTLDVAEGLIPVHPNCRCITLPVAKEPIRRSRGITDRESTTPPQLANNPWNPKAPNGSLRKMGIQQVRGNNTRVKNYMEFTGKELGQVFSRCSKLEGYVANANAEGKMIENLFYNDKRNLTHLGNGIDGVYLWKQKGLTMANRTMELANLSPVSNTIRFGKYDVGSGLRAVLRHEYGHHVHLSCLPPAEKGMFDAFYRNKGADYFKKNVSRYGATNEQEAFAETFSACTHKNYKKGQLPKDLEDLMVTILGLIL